ncbi:MAG: hypothetical protein V4603_00470, partial [Pseudomonadota bacterium]
MSRTLLQLLSLPVTTLLMWQGTVLAQVPASAPPKYDPNYILFEAHPLPTAPLAALPFSGDAPLPRPDLLGNLPTAPLVSSIDRASAEATVAAYEGNIDAMLNVETPYSPELFEQLLGLSSAYQQLGQHEEALTTLEKAEFLGRIKNGLYAPDQFVVVNMMIESLMASGQMLQAMEKQQYLLYLQRQHYGAASKELTPGLERLGDWSMQAFSSGVHESNSIGFSLGGGNSQNTLSPRGFAIASLDAARFRYYDAIEILVTGLDFGNPQLPALEAKLLHNLYLAGHRRGLLENPSFYLDSRTYMTGSRIAVAEFQYNSLAYGEGRDALQRLQYYQLNFHNTDPAVLLHTTLSLADWHLLFNHHREARAVYKEAWSLMQQVPSLAATGATLLNPAVPVTLPDFMPLPHSRGHFGIEDNSAQQFDGYFDVGFDVSRSGDIAHLRILARSDNATAPLERRLRRLLTSTPQRPRLEDGVPVASEDLRVRYYFA